MNHLFRLSFLLIIFCFSLSNLYSQRPQNVALQIFVGHSDSAVNADVRANGNPATFDPVDKRYIVYKKDIKARNNRLIIKKNGFGTESLSIDSIFKAYQQYTDVHVGVKLKHRWDSVYFTERGEGIGYPEQDELMILHSDSALVFKTIKGRNLYITQMFNYCGSTKEAFAAAPPPNAYILVHCYGAPVAKKNSTYLKHLRSILGDENAGPVVRNAGNTLLLTNKIELAFSANTNTERREEIIKQFQLKIGNQTSHNPNLYMLEADTGIGDHIIGIAHRLKELKEVESVRNIFNSIVCPDL